jgi:tetratricopeptide (TPR) repeat protein
LNDLVFNYRDPIFGIIAIFVLIFLASFFTYSFNIYNERKSRKEYKKLLKKFEINDLEEEDYISLYKTYNIPFDSIILIASIFLKKGDTNKAINVYLSLLEHVKEQTKKEELLELLGKTYFKSGFLQRSKDIYLKVVKFNPHNTEALKSLLIIFEKLKNYPKCLEVLESLDELEVDVYNDYLYINTISIIEDPLLSYENKSTKLIEKLEEDKLIQRIVLEYILMFNREFFWKNLNSFNLKLIIDILWYLPKENIYFDNIKNNKFLNELYTAKGYLSTASKSDIFELGVLIATNHYEHKIPIDLNFNFVCDVCKNTHPIYTARCPHCNSILSFNVKQSLAKGFYEKNSSLQ